jgi:hypothetical protein
MWISRKEYDDHGGASIVHRKCFWWRWYIIHLYYFS